MFPEPPELKAARAKRFEERANSPRVQQLVRQRLQSFDQPSSEQINELVQLLATEDLFDEMSLAYLRHMQWAKRLAAAHGFTCLFYWQPNLYTKDVLSADEQLFAPQFERNRASFEAAYAHFEQRRRQGIQGDPRWRDLQSVKNLADLFDTEEWSEQTAFIDAAHATELANRAIAGAMLDDVLQIIARKNEAREESNAAEP